MPASLVSQKITAPFLESFELDGLYEYKNITLRFERNVKIISAENGSGKTTLLNILYALLTGKMGPLLSTNFSRFSLKFAGHPAITANRADLFPQFAKEYASQIAELPVGREARAYGLSDSEFQEMVLFSAMGAEEDFRVCAGYRKLFDDSPFNTSQIKAMCDRVIPEASMMGKFAEVQAKIKEVLGDVSVLYLPTFRRIEADMPEYQRSHANPLARREKDDWDADRLIFFGLQDVEQRLRTITADIRKSTFEAYSRISARTLDQLLIAGTSSTEMAVGSVDVAALKVVLARLGKTDSEAEVRMIDLIESGHINDGAHDSLRSFLGQLLEIYQEKRDSEQAVEAFVGVVDSYWKQQQSEKKFHFDKLTVNAQVINNYTSLPLPLSALSSGEKQIVSVFARLYLDAGKHYIILIDEPELSLSMEWQQKFLPDVLCAPSCTQLIAITHSPFTFDNELDSFAGSLDISYSRDPAK